MDLKSEANRNIAAIDLLTTSRARGTRHVGGARERAAALRRPDGSDGDPEIDDTIDRLSRSAPRHEVLWFEIRERRPVGGIG